MTNSYWNVAIHVGLPKAGSTYLQHTLFSDHPELCHMSRCTSSIVYHICEMIVSSNPQIIRRTTLKDDVDAELRNQSSTIKLLSREQFVGSAYNSFLTTWQNGQLLKKFFPYARILLVVRRQDHFLESVYHQSLQQGHAKSISAFLGYSRSERRFTPPPLQDPTINIDIRGLDWTEITKIYDELFGRENVLVLPFELLRQDEDGFFSAVCDFWGISRYVRRTKSAHRVQNRSFSRHSAYVALVLNRFLRRRFNTSGFIPEQPFYDKLSAAAETRPSLRPLAQLTRCLQLRGALQQGVDRIWYTPAKFITEDKSAEIMRLHRDSNRELARRIGIDLSQWGYY